MAQPFTVEEVTLNNLADGALLRQFRERMQEIALLFAERDGYAGDKNGTIKVKLSMEAVFTCDKDGQATVMVMTDLRTPKRKGSMRPIFYRPDAGWLTMPQEQKPLLVPGVGNGTGFAPPIHDVPPED